MTVGRDARNLSGWDAVCNGKGANYTPAQALVRVANGAFVRIDDVFCRSFGRLPSENDAEQGIMTLPAWTKPCSWRLPITHVAGHYDT